MGYHDEGYGQAMSYAKKKQIPKIAKNNNLRFF